MTPIDPLTDLLARIDSNLAVLDQLLAGDIDRLPADFGDAVRVCAPHLRDVVQRRKLLSSRSHMDSTDPAVVCARQRSRSR